MANIKVAVVNASTALKGCEVNDVSPALQTQVHRDFAPAWGVDTGERGAERRATSG